MESYKDIHDFWNAKNALKGSRFEERIVRVDGELCYDMVKSLELLQFSKDRMEIPKRTTSSLRTEFFAVLAGCPSRPSRARKNSLEHESCYGLGMDALVTVCSWNKRNYGLAMDALLIALITTRNAPMVTVCF